MPFPTHYATNEPTATIYRPYEAHTFTYFFYNTHWLNGQENVEWAVIDIWKCGKNIVTEVLQ